MGDHAWIEDVYWVHKDYLDGGGVSMSFYAELLEDAGMTDVMKPHTLYLYLLDLRTSLTQLQRNLIGRANLHGEKKLGSHDLIETRGNGKQREITIAFYTLFWLFEKEILESEGIAVLGSPLHIFIAISRLFGEKFAKEMFKLLDGSPYPKYSSRKSDIYKFVCNFCAVAKLGRSRNAGVTSMITLVAKNYNIPDQWPDSKKRAKKEEIEEAKTNVRALDDPSQILTFSERDIFNGISEHENSNVLQYAILTAIESKLEPLRQAQQEKRNIGFPELIGTREDLFNLLERELGPFMKDVILLKCNSNSLNLKASAALKNCPLCTSFRVRLEGAPKNLVVQLERVKVWNNMQRFDIFHDQDKKDELVFKAVAEKFNLLDNFEDERESIERARIVALKPVFPTKVIGTFHSIRKREDSQELHLHIYEPLVPKLSQIENAVRNNQRLSFSNCVGKPKDLVALFEKCFKKKKKPAMTNRILKAFNNNTTVHSATISCKLCTSLTNMFKKNLPELARILREVRDYVNSTTEKGPVSQDSTQPISIKDSFAPSVSLMNEDESQVHEDEDEDMEKKMAAMESDVSTSTAVSNKSIKTSTGPVFKNSASPTLPDSFALSVPSSDTIKLEQWNCEKCTFLNSINDSACTMCGTEKTTKTSVPSSDTMKLEQWECQTCFHLNSMDDSACAMCSTGKTAKMSPSLENSASASLPSSDKCDRSVIELDMSSEGEESEEEELEEEYVDEALPSETNASTIQRQSKRLRTGNSV